MFYVSSILYITTYNVLKLDCKNQMREMQATNAVVACSIMQYSKYNVGMAWKISHWCWFISGLKIAIEIYYFTKSIKNNMKYCNFIKQNEILQFYYCIFCNINNLFRMLPNQVFCKRAIYFQNRKFLIG